MWCFFFFLYKQTTADEMRISYWSSDVCSSDLWLTPRRFEPFVFIIAGRNVAPGRFRRCLESILRQRRDDWGAIVIDDASTPAWAEEIALLCQPHAQRITFLHNRMRMGLLANMTQAIRHHCSNPATVIITLDADDCLRSEERRAGKGCVRTGRFRW